MSCEIIIRHAQAEDLQQRMELVRNGYSGYFWNACLFFFFQELTLECCVLAAAILFIFFGVSATTCLLLLPAVAAIVAAAVASVHYSLAHKHSQSLREEIFGIVAELKGALQLDPGARKVPIKIQLDAKKESSYLQVPMEILSTSIELPVDIPSTSHHIPMQIDSIPTQLIGTVSVSEFWGPQNSGWLHALVVHSKWRGRGAGRALAGAARRAAAARGLDQLLAAASALQPAACAALHAAGWECRASYERPLCGAALTLPLVRLGLDLPLA